MPFNLYIDKKIMATYKGYAMKILYVSNIYPKKNFNSVDILRSEESILSMKFTCDSLLDEKYISGWRDTYKKFGAKARSAVSSVEALAQRVLQGHNIPDIGHIVNIYNAISLKYLLPVGGEDRDSLKSDLIFSKSTGKEPFIVGKDTTYPKKGEPIWLDSLGVTCRRWNWRQSSRTQISNNTRNAYFVLDCLPIYQKDDLEKAKKELINLLYKLSPSIKVMEDQFTF